MLKISACVNVSNMEMKYMLNINFCCVQFSRFLILYFFPVIDTKPIGQRILPLEYLQCREKPATFTWDEWYQFANEQYKQHQVKLLDQQEKDEQARQARIETQKKQAEQLSLNIAREFLPGLTIEAEMSSVSESSVLLNIKQEPDSKMNTAAGKSDEGAGREKWENSLQSEYDKAEQLSQATINFLKELTELFMDKDVLLTMRHLKFMGKQMWSNECNIEVFQKEVDANKKYERECAATEHPMQSSSHQVSRSLDFSHIGADIKQEKDDDFNLLKVKKHFPGTKKASYEELQEQFQSKKRKTTPSPGRAAKSGFGSPPAKQARIGEVQDYKAMTDTKQKVIACGTEVLKKKKNAKNLDAIVHKLDSMGREILQAPDYSFYHLMSYFDNKYIKLSDTT